jgi:hypothetical protein
MGYRKVMEITIFENLKFLKEEDKTALIDMMNDEDEQELFEECEKEGNNLKLATEIKNLLGIGITKANQVASVMMSCRGLFCNG